jgi:hypothetical protein
VQGWAGEDPEYVVVLLQGSVVYELVVQVKGLAGEDPEYVVVLLQGSVVYELT